MNVSDHKFAIKRCRLDDLWYVDIVGGESVVTEILSGPLEPFDIEYIATRSMASVYFEKAEVVVADHHMRRCFKVQLSVCTCFYTSTVVNWQQIFFLYHWDDNEGQTLMTILHVQS